MNKYDIWFSLVKLSPIIKYNLLKHFNSFEDILQVITSNNIEGVSGLKEKVIYELKNAYDEEKIYNIQDIMVKEDIKITSYFNKDYPEKLRNIVDPPAVLFYKGDLNKINNRSVSIVGARECTLYGENVTEEICRILSGNNINIISGLARGIDTTSHKTSLKENNYTCGVLGCGVNNIYPKENKKIYDEMEQKGLIISEYIPNAKPNSWHFPIRNRIISGLCELLIIIEASEKSGSLITANLALEQGKDVMSVPGSVFSKFSRGTNKLIKDGAHVFTCEEDLYEILKIQKQNVKNIKNNVNLKGEEVKILSILSDKPMHINEIVKLTNIDIERLLGVLFEMQTFSKIRCICGNFYVKNQKLA
ncbi:DNA-processing protein DprA [Hathewaya histolytica]|uniref:DNA-processing protein DprA n=1 Tax=Hathewaya histolytica TaxID=1498 RepID=UPI003B66C18D